MGNAQLITAVVSNEQGEIFDLEGYAAVGMAGDSLFPLTDAGTVDLPFGSELMRLPDRVPVLYDMECRPVRNDGQESLRTGYKTCYPVAAFNSPGHVITQCLCAYREKSHAKILPLFSYGAVGWHGDGFRSAAIQVDPEPRQDLRFMQQADVLQGH
jgi:hypothetical protein